MSNNLGLCQKHYRNHSGAWVPDATTAIRIEGQPVPVCDKCAGSHKTQEFWRFLTEGTPPEGFNLPGWTPLPPAQAFHILYVVQEYLKGLPDTWELCDGCQQLLDSDGAGFLYTNSGHYCDGCRGDYGARCARCEEDFDWADLATVGDEYLCRDCAGEQ